MGWAWRWLLSVQQRGEHDEVVIRLFGFSRSRTPAPKTTTALLAAMWALSPEITAVVMLGAPPLPRHSIRSCPRC